MGIRSSRVIEYVKRRLLQQPLFRFQLLSRPKKAALGVVGLVILGSTPVATLALQDTPAASFITETVDGSRSSDTSDNITNSDSHSAASVQINVNDTQQQSTSTASPSSSSQVTVNGQEVPVPSSGHIQKVIEDDGNKTTVDISIQNDGSSTISSQSHTSTDIQIYSHSTGDSDTTDPRSERRSSTDRY